MTKIFDDGVMEATQYPEGWVFIRWINNKRGKLQKKLVKDLIHIEDYIFKNKLKGWFTSSELDHKEFQTFIHRVGASFMAKDAAFVYLNKWITKDEDLYVRQRS